MFPIKSIQLRGNLMHEISYKLCPNTEFSSGNWQIAVTNACIDLNEDLDFFCTISSNFCVNHRYDQSGAIETYEQPLFTFLLNGKRLTKVFHSTSPVWFEINRLSDVLILRFTDCIQNTKSQANCDISVTLLVQRKY